MRDLGNRTGLDDTSFGNHLEMTHFMNQDDNIWGFKDETLDRGFWPERYNKMHNYFLLSKNEKERDVIRKYEEVHYILLYG